MNFKNMIYSFSPRLVSRITAAVLSVVITFVTVKIATAHENQPSLNEQSSEGSFNTSTEVEKTEKDPVRNEMILDGSVEVGNVINGFSGILCDLTSNNVLAVKNSFGKVSLKHAASLIGALTVSKAVSDGKAVLSDTAVCPASAARCPDYELSSEVLPIGKRMRVGDILKCMLYQEGSSYAYTLAVHIFGSEEAYVNEMNALCSEMKLNETSLSGCNEGVFSVYDLSVIMKRVLSDPLLRQIFCENGTVSVGYGQNESVSLVVKNAFFQGYCTEGQAKADGIIGGKVSVYPGGGWACVVFSREGREYLSVSLGSAEAFTDTMMLYSAFVLSSQ